MASPEKVLLRKPLFDNRTGAGNGADVSNPFIVPSASKSSASSSASSRPTSPVKSAKESTSSHSLHQLRKSMGSMEVVGAMKSSGSSHVEKESKDVKSGRNLDRFIPNRPPSADASFPSLAHAASASSANASATSLPDLSGTATANHSSADLSASMGLPGPHTRILSFQSAPPPSSSSHHRNPHAGSHLDLSRQYVQSGLDPRTAASSSAGGARGVNAATKRRIPSLPERVLDAPGFVNDYYLNLLSWSCTNKVAIGLGATAYIWDADSGDVKALGDADQGEDEEEGPAVCALAWAADGSYLGVGNENGDVEIWDVDAGVKMRTMSGHLARVATLSWNGSILSSGCRDGSIHHHDVRVARHKVQELKGHRAEVCGLTWRADGQFLASGGNDNVVNCWDGRIGQSVLTDSEGLPTAAPKWQKTSHIAAVKALAWCPWQNSLLATGGGTNDQTIHFWSSTTGARLSSLPTSSQVTSLQWSNHSKEIMSTHGFPDNSIALWSYPSLQKVGEIKTAHDERILGSAVSPDGCTVVTGASDENLKFWKLWEAKTVHKKGVADKDENAGARSRQQMWR